MINIASKMTLLRGRSFCGRQSVRVLELRRPEKKFHYVSTKELKLPNPTQTKFTPEKLLAYTLLKRNDRTIVLLCRKTVYNYHFCRPFDSKNPFLAPVLVNRELHPAGDRSCMHIELGIEDSRIRYDAGT